MPQRKPTVRLWGTSKYLNRPKEGATGVVGDPTGANLVSTDDPAWGPHLPRSDATQSVRVRPR